MSLKQFLQEPELKKKGGCCTILTIGRPRTGKTYNMLECIKRYWLPRNTFDEYHLVLPNFTNEQNDSYDFIRQIKSKTKFIYIYNKYHPMIVTKLLDKQNGKNKKRLFFGLDDTTSQSKQLFKCPEMVKLATQSRHYNVHTWLIMHYGKGIVEPKVRANIGFLFINRIKYNQLIDIYKEFVDFPEQFPDHEAFEKFAWAIFKRDEYPCILIDLLHDRFNPNVGLWWKKK